MQPLTTSHNNPQPPTTTQNYPEPPTTIHNNPKNYSQPSTTTQKLSKKAKTCHQQLCYCTLDVNTETDVDFDSDMKQWYIYTCVCVSVCIYFISHYIYYFLVRLTVAVDINVETLKDNGILLPQFAQNLVEAFFLKKYIELRFFTRKLVKNKVSRNFAILLYGCLPINNIHRPKNRILF